MDRGATDRPAFEEELILGCVRWSLGQFDLNAIRLLADHPIEWKRLPELAGAHGLTPVIADCLRLAASPIPPSITQTLHSSRRQNAKRAFVFSTALGEIAEQCARDGVRVVSLKGPALAALYPDPSWRVFADLDLLVAPGQIEPALESLSKLGYRSAEARTVRTARRRYRAWEFEIPLEHPDLGINIELHWRLLPRGFPARLPVDDFLDRSESVDFEGSRVCVPSLPHHLLFLSAHGAKHGWSSLDLVVDICRLVQSFGGRDLGPAFDLARQYGAAKMLEFALTAAESLMQGTGSGIPARNFSAAGPKAINSVRFPLALSDSARAKASFLAHRIFVPKESEWVSLRLPWRGLYPLYFPWRLLRSGFKLVWRGLP